MKIPAPHRCATCGAVVLNAVARFAERDYTLVLDPQGSMIEGSVRIVDGRAEIVGPDMPGEKFTQHVRTCGRQARRAA